MLLLLLLRLLLRFSSNSAIATLNINVAKTHNKKVKKINSFPDINANLFGSDFWAASNCTKFQFCRVVAWMCSYGTNWLIKNAIIEHKISQFICTRRDIGLQVLQSIIVFVINANSCYVKEKTMIAAPFRFSFFVFLSIFKCADLVK